MTATVILIVVASALVVGLVAALVVQHRRTSNRSFDSAEAAALSESQRIDDRQGWS